MPTRQPCKDPQTEFVKIIKDLSYTQSYYTVFNDFLDFALLMMNWDKQPQDFAGLERRWPHAEQHKKFAELLLLYSEAAEHNGEGFYDPLGDIYMELLANERKGQFFTPQDVCEMMALLTYGDQLQPGKTAFDPACGSGRCLLAIAKLERNLIFYAADIDELCCKMTVLNMLVNTMEGEVAHMDTLALKHYKSWHIKKFMNIDGHYLPYYVTTGPGETTMIAKIKNSLIEKPVEPVLKDVEPMQSMNQLSLF